ncbi:FecR family protein [Methylobacterium sp. sgz302541]|uniref:FecR family protein n=1 Tax=unclassified Methylobacterium TaxID=2615210 RepID=UPI003D325752
MDPNTDPDDLPPDPASLDPLTKTALDWQVRLHAGEDEAGARAGYDRWLDEDPAHRAAGRRAETLWRALGPALRGRKSRMPALVGGLGLAGALGFLFLSGAFGPPEAYFADERTAVGERRNLVLADGSRVELDGGTSLDVRFDGGRRRLVLYAGQIFVTVTPDAGRPFVVEADTGTARALGTAFDMRQDETGTSVFVTEHRVRVDAGAKDVTLGEGQQVAYTRAGLGAVETVDTRKLSAWRQGRLAFEGRPLAEVAAAIGRYRRGRIVLAGAGLDRLRVTGTFAAGDSERMLDALEAALPIRVLRLPWLVVIRADPERAAGSR